MNLQLAARPGFVVLWGFRTEDASRVRTLAARRWPHFCDYSCEDCLVLAGHPGANLQALCGETVLGVLNGYVGVLSPEGRAEKNEGGVGAEEVLRRIAEREWPLGAEVTGSFCAAVVNRTDRTVTLCCDPVGPYPAFYVERDGKLVLSTSLTLAAEIFASGPDLAGVIQSLPYPFVTYGSRTLAERVKRLLPGEARVYRDGQLVERRFDTTLYKNVHGVKQNSAVEQYLDVVRREVRIATGSANACHIGLSGGIDSRFLLGVALEGGIEVACHTMGAHHDYEVKLARRIASITGVPHFVYPLDGSYFPDAKTFHRVVHACEAVPYLQWMPVLSWSGGRQRLPFFIGDLCEAAAGRTVQLKGGRMGRALGALRELWWDRPRLTKSDPKKIRAWCETQVATLVKQIVQEASRGANQKPSEHVIDEIRGDIEESLGVIKRFEPEYVELYDELLTWFHYIRIMAFGQILLLDTVFDAACPLMGMAPMRVITSVDPELRTLQRFIDKILRSWRWKELSRLPTANAPFVAASAPSIVRDCSWAGRWLLDQVLQRLFVRTKGRLGYRRAVPSTDYFRLYREANVEEVKRWYLGRLLNEQHYMDRFMKRRHGERWPLINNTIAGPATVELLALRTTES